MMWSRKFQIGILALCQFTFIAYNGGAVHAQRENDRQLQSTYRENRENSEIQNEGITPHDKESDQGDHGEAIEAIDDSSRELRRQRNKHKWNEGKKRNTKNKHNFHVWDGDIANYAHYEAFDNFDNFDNGGWNKSGKRAKKSKKSKRSKQSWSGSRDDGRDNYDDEKHEWEHDGHDNESKFDAKSGKGKSGKSSWGGSNNDHNDHWDPDGWNAPHAPHEWQHTVPTAHFEAEILHARNEIAKLIHDSQGELIPKFLRLGFHDCVGGCDGCVDLTDPHNFGLDTPIEAIGYILRRYQYSLSRADIWALATLTAADMAIAGHRPAGLQFPMRYFGRVDCHTADDIGRGGPSRAMPSNDYTTHELLNYFKTVFGFTVDETVAIMGVHSVATASRPNSGFGHPHQKSGWVYDVDSYTLNNRYYAMIVGDYEHGIDHPALSPEWEVEYLLNDRFPGQPNRHQWYHPDGVNGQNGQNGERPLMLNADMALVRNLEGYMSPRHDGSFGQVNCFFNEASRDYVLNHCNGLVYENEIVAELSAEVNFGLGDGKCTRAGRAGSTGSTSSMNFGYNRELEETSEETSAETPDTLGKLGNLRNLNHLHHLPPLCPMASETIHIALKYKMDNELWLLEFQDALEKMLLNGYF